ncbi:MAG: tetratricopeptide repeat protein [Candidatus Helarchaeota archaeon]
MSEIKSSIETAREYFNKKNFEKSIEILQDLLQRNQDLLKKDEFKKELGDINLLFAESLLALKKFDESLKRANQCLQLAIKSKNFSLQAKTLRVLGSVHSQKGNHIKSLELLRKSLQLEQKIGDKIGEAYALLELGIEEADGDEIKEGAEHLKHALKIFKVLNREKDAKIVEKELNVILEEISEDEWLKNKIPEKIKGKKRYQFID